MKELLLTISLSIVSVFQFGSNDIELYTYWKTGDTQKITIEEGFINYEGDKVVKKDVSTTTVNVSVLEQTDTTYTIEWGFSNYVEEKVNIEEEEEDEIDKRIEDMFDNVTLRYQTNEYGEILRILNIDEIINAVGDSMDIFIKEEMPDLGKDAEMFS